MEETGTFENVPDRDYRAWPGASNSILNLMMRTPAHAYEKLANPTEDEDVEALVIGKAVHLAILEPDSFKRNVGYRPNGLDLRKPDHKEAYLQAKGASRIFFDNSTGRTGFEKYQEITKIADAVRKHPAAKKLLDKVTATELSFQWKNSGFGLLCKGRADALAPDIGCIIDVKTTKDAGPGKFGFVKSIFDYGYHRQAAHYIDGLRALGLNISHFVWIAVEKTPPYELCVYRATAEILESGWNELQPLYEQYAVCIETGVWPGYPTMIIDVETPKWLRK